MAEPFVGEIRMFAGTFAPVNWNFCDGTLLPIAQNDVLYSLIGTTYGGDGQTNFALPDLRSRVPMHQGAGNTLGQAAGTENVTLTTGQLPSHSHRLMATSTGQVLSPANALPAVATSAHSGEIHVYGPAAGSPTNLNPVSVQTDGSGLPHNNVQPYLAISFIIALVGLYPAPP